MQFGRDGSWEMRTLLRACIASPLYLLEAILHLLPGSIWFCDYFLLGLQSRSTSLLRSVSLTAPCCPPTVIPQSRKARHRDVAFCFRGSGLCSKATILRDRRVSVSASLGSGCFNIATGLHLAKILRGSTLPHPFFFAHVRQPPQVMFPFCQ